MFASVTPASRFHAPVVPLSRVRARHPRSLAAEEDAIRRQWESLLAAAMSPAERDELNDVFGRVLR